MVVALLAVLVGSTVRKPALCNSPPTLRARPSRPTPLRTRTVTSSGATLSVVGFAEPAALDAAFGEAALSLMIESQSFRPATASRSTLLPPRPGGGGGKPGGL